MVEEVDQPVEPHQRESEHRTSVIAKRQFTMTTEKRVIYLTNDFKEFWSCNRNIYGV